MEEDTFNSVSLQLLLFVDERPTSVENVRRIQSYLQSLREEYPFELQVIEIGKQPHLVEHFKLLATPALVKIAPAPKQTLAGSNLIEQLKKWWPRWQQERELDRRKDNHFNASESADIVSKISDLQSIGYSEKLLRLSDDIFRLKKEKEELLEQLRFKDQILAMLAHDLRSPLTAASLAVETLEITQNQEDSDRIIQLREKLYKQARKQFRLMNRMITNILQASKTAQLKIEPKKILLQCLCDEIVTQMAEQFAQKSQQFDRDIPGDLPTVYADGELIRQVIVNLLENAIKYTPEGGKISLSILHRTSQKIQVTVCDTGPGIPLEKQERIFEGHFRLQRDQEKEGYGLGLSLCRKVIRAHYGQIWVDSSSEKGKGSCFHFTLPVYR